MGIGEFFRHVTFFLRRHKRLEEIEDEMRLHADLRARALEKNGMAPEAATIAAKRKLGNRTLLKEAAWDLWSFAFLENAWRDLRFALRVLRTNPGFTSVAVLTLALGIGATTAMFSVIDNVLLEPFPYAAQQRLVSIVIHDSSSKEPGGRTMFPAAEFFDYQKDNRVFEDVMGVAISRALWTTGGPPESINAPLVTPNAFEFLGVAPLLGRYATAADVGPGATPICVMSYSFWKSRFAGDPGVIGKMLILDNTPRKVIGVMPRRFIFWSADVWIPVVPRIDPHGFPPPWFYLLGRLKAGLNIETADQQIQILAERLAKVYRPNLYPYRFTARLETFADSAVGKFKTTLFTLLAAVGLLLLIACANVASLLLARVSDRRREFAIRGSLGAGWWRVVRQLFVESGVLAFLGAAAGCGFAWAGLQLLIAILPADTFPEEAVIGLNLRVLAATVAIAVGTAFFFGLIPVLSGLRRDVNDALKAGGRGHSAFRRGQIRNALIVCEVAVSVVLLAAAGVLMRSFLHDREVQLGFNPEHLLTAEIFLTKGHRSVAQQATFTRELIGALRQAPGVLDVATTSDFPPFGGAITEFSVDGKPHSNQYEGRFATISPDLFHTLDARLLRGRNVTEADVFGKHMVAVVNQAFVQKFFPREDPIGKRVEITTLAYLREPIRDPSLEIVGVVANFKNRGLRETVLPQAFIPYSISGLGGFSLIVRTVGQPQALARAVEGTALTLDGTAVVRHMRSMQDGLNAEEYAKPRFGLEIFAVFASLGLLLVGAGLYSVMSYTVSQRKHELGIRMALGANAGGVQAMVIGTQMRFLAAGIAAGLLAAFLLLRFIQNQVWGVSIHDPATLAGVVAILVVAGVAACYIPTLAITRLDPAETLRSE